MTEISSEQAYREGRLAYEVGDDKDNCPYTESLLAAMWVEGFNDAENGVPDVSQMSEEE